MDASIEMKFLHLKRLIEIRNQLVAVQGSLNVGCGLFDSIIIHSKEDFFEYAQLLRLWPKPSEEIRELDRYAITYNGLELVSYMSEEEYQHYTAEFGKESKACT